MVDPADEVLFLRTESFLPCVCIDPRFQIKTLSKTYDNPNAMNQSFSLCELNYNPLANLSSATVLSFLQTLWNLATAG